jgi:hypothetical protein
VLRTSRLNPALTAEERVQLLTGRDFWTTRPIQKIMIGTPGRPVRGDRWR